MPKLYEIVALVKYATVIRADSRQDAMKEVATWEHAWEANADPICVSDVELLEERDGDAEDAHVDVSRDAARAATVMRSRSAARAAAGFCGIVNILVCRYRGYTAPGSAAPRCGAREPCVVHRARES